MKYLQKIKEGNKLTRLFPKQPNAKVLRCTSFLFAVVAVLLGMMPLVGYGQNRANRDCEPIMVTDNQPFEEYFETSTGDRLPECWRYINDATDEYNIYFPCVSQDYFYECNSLAFEVYFEGQEENLDQYAILPAMENISGLQMTFDADGIYYTDYGNMPAPFAVGVMTDPTDPATFQLVKSFTCNENKEAYSVYFHQYTGSGQYIAIMVTTPDYYESTSVYIDDIVVSVLPSCLTPSNVSVNYSSITESSAMVSWTPNGNETAWDIHYSTDQTNWTSVSAPQNPYTLEGLNANTVYYLQVRANCGDGDYSTWSSMVSFRTGCPQYQSIPYSENFDSYEPYDPNGGEPWKGMNQAKSGDLLPFCWTSWNGSDYYEYFDYPYIYYDEYIGLESNCLKFNVYNYDYFEEGAIDQYAILPAFQNVSGLQMSFTAKVGEFLGDNVPFSVGVMTDPTDPEGFVEIQALWVDKDWNNYVVYFDTYLGEGEYIAIKVGTPAEWETYSLFIDDLEVSVLPSCFVPSKPLVSNIDENEVTLTWTPYGNETAWQVRYSTDETNWTMLSYTDQDWNEIVSVQLAGLHHNTSYYIQVRANCGDGDYSDWSLRNTFRTACASEYQELPYYEDFETYPNYYPEYVNMPQCWDKINTSQEFSAYPIISDEGHDGHYNHLYFYMDKSGDPRDQIVILPRMENISNLQLRFIGRGEEDHPAINEYYNRVITIGVYDDENVFHEISNVELHKTKFKRYLVVFNNYSGSNNVGRIAFCLKTPGVNKTDSYARIDEISVTEKLVYKTFVTEGNWNDASNWENGDMPTSSNDNALIQAAAIIPEDCVAIANVIDLNGNDASITVADGGQLITNSEVEVKVQKNIAPHGETVADGGWYLIASPIQGDVDFYYIDGFPGFYMDYALYYFDENPADGDEWRNVKKEWFNYLSNGKGYLYANAQEVELGFNGRIRPCTPNVDVPLAYHQDAQYAGWNLVGNPFTFNAYVNRSYYKMNANGSGFDPTEQTGTVAPCTGIMVKADETGQSVTFSNEPVETQSKGNLQITLSQARERGASAGSATLDKAIVSFNEGSSLLKFYFNGGKANVFIPQDDKEYAIVFSNGMGEMPINFVAKENGSYTLNIGSEEVDFNYLHLIDNMTGADVDLLQKPSYTFKAFVDDYESRFKLLFATSNADTEGDTSFAFFSNGSLLINNDGEATLQIIDVTGRILDCESINGSCSKVINAVPGVYVLRLINGDKVKVQKIVVG